MKLKPCPCGKTPKTLHIYSDEEKPKWAYVYPNCCGEWHIEYKNLYCRKDSDEAKKLAAEAWNQAPRAGDET